MSELSDAELIGEHRDLDRLDPLTDDERLQLSRYRNRTEGFEARSEEFIARAPQPGEQVDDDDARAMLNTWNAAWKELRDWHNLINDSRSVNAQDPDDSNPVTKVLKHEGTAIGGLGAKLV